MRIYAIGDIHGQLAMLRQAHARIEADRARTGDLLAPVVHLGDLVDRGPDSKGVLQFLIDGIARGAPWIVLKGNHDQIFAQQLSDDAVTEIGISGWASASMGGSATLDSYGVRHGLLATPATMRKDLRNAVPETHRHLIEGLALWHETPDLLFVHAGIKPGRGLAEQTEDDLLWIRSEFLDDSREHEWLIVHGHTPVAAPIHCGNRVNLDTGAGYDRHLTAAVFEGREAWVLDDNERRPLTPP